MLANARKFIIILGYGGWENIDLAPGAEGDIEIFASNNGTQVDILIESEDNNPPSDDNPEAEEHH